MNLGDRTAQRHTAIAKTAVVSSDYWDFAPGQRVMTREGFAGVVTAVSDGPVAGAEEYEVTLDAGLGGGAYAPGELRPLDPPLAAEAALQVEAAGWRRFTHGEFADGWINGDGSIILEKGAPGEGAESRGIWTWMIWLKADPSEYTVDQFGAYSNTSAWHGPLRKVGDDWYIDTGYEGWGLEDAKANAAHVLERRGHTAAVTGKDYEGQVGNRDHVTRHEDGTLPISAIAHLQGVKGERPGEHRNKQGAAWDEFKADIAANGIQNPIFITVDYGDEPRISEGNHRRDAAVELGLDEVPVEIRYFGHAEQAGSVGQRTALVISPGHPTARCITCGHYQDPSYEQAYLGEVEDKSNCTCNSPDCACYRAENDTSGLTWKQLRERKSASETRTAADDYPELGNILEERPDHEHAIPVSASLTKEGRKLIPVTDESPRPGFDVEASWFSDHATDYLTRHTPTEFRTDPEHAHSVDWCRFRRNSRCFFSHTLDEAATQQAGYVVWTPEDRGFCPRITWDSQRECPIGEPGPNSGAPNAGVEATVPWEQGGQRYGALHAEAFQAEGRWHLTATWRDVRAKAKRIRSEGGVRIIAAPTQTDTSVVAEVRGDHNIYETTITREPGKHAVAMWTCGCAWASYSWGRSGRWKRYEGRMCSHALALTYEVQAKGMFGKTILEDREQPAWRMDPTIPVIQPQNYPKPKRRSAALDRGDAVVIMRHPRYNDAYSAHVEHDGKVWSFDCGHLHHTPEAAKKCVPKVEKDWKAWRDLPREELGFNDVVEMTRALDRPGAVQFRRMSPETDAIRHEGSLRPLETDKVLEIAPAVLIAQGMLSQGYSPNETLDTLVDMGLPNAVGMIAEALAVKPFKAKVRGWVRKIVQIVNGHAVTETGDEVPLHAITYPTYDPTLGLDLDDSKPHIAATDPSANIMAVTRGLEYILYDATRDDDERDMASELLTLIQSSVPENLHDMGMSEDDPNYDAEFWGSCQSGADDYDPDLFDEALKLGRTLPGHYGQGADTTLRDSVPHIAVADGDAKHRVTPRQFPEGKPPHFLGGDVCSGCDRRIVQAGSDQKGRPRYKHARPRIGESPLGWRHYFGSASGADTKGVMICLKPPERICNTLADLGTEPADNIHITLAYFGGVDEVDGDALHAAVRTFAEKAPSLIAEVSGLGTFENGEENVLMATWDIPGIDRFRADLVEHCRGFDQVPYNNHGFTPHATLSYGDEPFRKLPALPDEAKERFAISEVWLTIGNEWASYSLQPMGATVADLTGDWAEALSEGYESGDVDADAVTWFAPSDAGQALAEQGAFSSRIQFHVEGVSEDVEEAADMAQAMVRTNGGEDVTIEREALSGDVTIATANDMSAWWAVDGAERMTNIAGIDPDSFSFEASAHEAAHIPKSYDGRPLYHGSNVVLSPGDTIEPAVMHGGGSRFVDHDYYDSTVVYSSDKPHLAGRFAYGVVRHAGGEPHVYEVRPIGSIYQDPESETGFGTDQWVSSLAEVVREVDKSEWGDTRLESKQATKRCRFCGKDRDEPLVQEQYRIDSPYRHQQGEHVSYHHASCLAEFEAFEEQSKARAAAEREAQNDEIRRQIEGELHDEPEPALPETDGADEDEEFAPGDQRLGWLMQGGGKDQSNSEIAAMARQFLKEGAKAFTPAEQRQIIDEGEGVLAANFDALDITGTHYEALEARLAEDEETEELLFG